MSEVDIAVSCTTEMALDDMTQSVESLSKGKVPLEVNMDALQSVNDSDIR
jgi:exonuclease VII small subunit